MENLAHSASLHPEDNIAPSNPGIKQLEQAIEKKALKSRDLGRGKA
jgi:hypothetical protein